MNRVRIEDGVVLLLDKKGEPWIKYDLTEGESLNDLHHTLVRIGQTELAGELAVKLKAAWRDREEMVDGFVRALERVANG